MSLSLRTPDRQTEIEKESEEKREERVGWGGGRYQYPFKRDIKSSEGESSKEESEGVRERFREDMR